MHNGWVEALRGLGQQVSEFELDRRLNFYSSLLLETGHTDGEGHPEIRHALSYDQSIELAANGILSACYQFWPDVVFCTSAFFTPPRVLDVIRKRRHKIVMLFSESPYQDGQQLKMAEYADLSLLNDPCNLPLYEAVGPAVYMPHAYRPGLHHPGAAVAEMVCDLAFVGTGYPSRIAFLEKMDLAGLDVFLAGNWLGLDPGSPLRPYVAHDDSECLDNEQTADVYRSARTGLNLYRAEAEDGHAGEGWAMGPREVEMAASQLFFLRDPRGEGDGVLPMLPTFTSPGEAGDKLRWWLAHDRQRETAAKLAREAVADRTFDSHARALLAMLDR